jgi:hypothetical protein
LIWINKIEQKRFWKVAINLAYAVKPTKREGGLEGKLAFKIQLRMNLSLLADQDQIGSTTSKEFVFQSFFAH